MVRIALASPAHIGQEFFRFEIATAVAGAIIGIHPFDQPDVEASKVKTRELTSAYEKTGSLPAEKPAFSDPVLSVFADEANTAALRKAGADGTLESWMKAHFSRVRPGDYVALLAYLARNERHMSALQDMRVAVRDKRRVATCAEFGPRFLHSSGQAYKGGPASGVFVQITTDPPEDLPVPGAAYASASSRRRKRAAISTCWPSVAAACCACISRATSRRACGPCRPPSRRAELGRKTPCSSASSASAAWAATSRAVSCRRGHTTVVFDRDAEGGRGARAREARPARRICAISSPSSRGRAPSG